MRRVLSDNTSCCRLLVLLSSVFAVILSVVVCVPALAEYVSPDEIDVATERYAPGKLFYAPGNYEYKIYWQGIFVARAAINVERLELPGHTLLIVQVSARTAKVIDYFYRLRHQSQSLIELDELRPLDFTSMQRENSKKRYTRMSFSKRGRVSITRWKRKHSPTNVEFVFDNSVFDPISAAFVAKSLKLTIGGTLRFDVFSGKHRYLISFVVEGRDELKTPGGMRAAYRVLPKVRKLTDTKGEKKLRSARIWISADSRQDILKLESKVWIGSIEAKLVRVSAPGDGAAALGGFARVVLVP